jgi:hypothetical protein
MAFLVADRGVVDDRVEKSKRVDLPRHLARPGDRLEVSDDNRFGPRQGAFRVGRAGCVARMEPDGETSLNCCPLLREDRVDLPGPS